MMMTIMPVTVSDALAFAEGWAVNDGGPRLPAPDGPSPAHVTGYAGSGQGWSRAPLAPPTLGASKRKRSWLLSHRPKPPAT